MMHNFCRTIAEPPMRLLEIVANPARSKPRNNSRQQPYASEDKSQNAGNLSPYIQKAFDEEVLRVAHAPEGSRNNALNIASVKLGHYVGGGEIERCDVEKAFLGAAITAGLCEAEALKTIASGLAKGMSEPKKAPSQKRPHRASGKDHRADAVININITPEDIIQAAGEQEQGAANLFKALFMDKLTYDHAEKQWYTFFIHSWKRDKIAQVYALVDEVQALYRREYMRISIERRALASQLALAELDAASDPEGGNGGNDDLKAQNKALAALERQLVKAIRMLQTSYHREQVVKLAAQGNNSLGLSGDEWDQFKGVLPCNNGLVDLTTGELRPGKPSDYLRTAAPHNFDPHAKCPIFERFLSEIMGDDIEIVGFLKRLLGYVIGGNPVEHVFPIFVGAGRNGKTILAEAVAHALGDLAWAVRAEFFLDSGRFGSADTPSPSQMSLRGRRFVYGSEPAEDGAFDIAKVKLVTGGDHLTGRYPYSKYEVSFSPTHVPILLANNKPAANAADEAFWRRVLIIEFPMAFVENPQKPNERQRDMGILDKLKAEAPGILRWLVEGHLEWRDKGLQVPAKVQAATLEYRSEADIVLQFVDDCCNRNAGNEESFRAIYEAYKRWAQEMRLPKIWSSKKFSLRLARHFDKGRDKGNDVVFRGLAVASSDERVKRIQEKHNAAMDLLNEAEEAEHEAREALEETKKLKGEDERLRQAMGCGSKPVQTQGRLS